MILPNCWDVLQTVEIFELNDLCYDYKCASHSYKLGNCTLYYNIIMKNNSSIKLIQSFYEC